MVRGIVRRIDDLGRIVINKEMRRVLKLREGDPMEMWIEGGQLRMVKYQEVQKVHNIENWAQALAELLGCCVLVTDRDDIITGRNGYRERIPRDDLGIAGSPISETVRKAIEDGGDTFMSSHMKGVDFYGTTLQVSGYIIVPIKHSRDIDTFGAVIAYSAFEGFGSAMDLRAVQTLAAVIEKEVNRE